jgi:hypothetical protein
MALIHRATLRPSKIELLSAWLPGRPWYPAVDGELERVAAYRFDDPADVVGIETLLVRAGGGPVYQVPLTYRDAPLDGAEGWLVGTSEHSALGKRWIYDAAGDPVYAAALANAVLADAGQAEELVDVDGTLEPRALTMDITSSGRQPVPAITTVRRVDGNDPTVIVTDTVELTVARVLGTPLAGVVLAGTWKGRDTPVALASAVG